MQLIRKLKAKFWAQLNYSPKEIPERRATWKAARRMFMAGTLGAFFTAFIRKVPLDISQLYRQPFDVAWTIDSLLRYGYLLWFLSFFCISNLRNDDPSRIVGRKEMLFDLMQVTLSLTAAYFLGFIVTSDHYGLSAYAFTNAAVLVICLVSLAFGDFEPIHKLRKMGVALSGLATVPLWLGRTGTPRVWIFVIFAALQACLWIILWAYGRIRAESIEPRPNT